MSENKKLRVAILWHMHQPYYFNPQNDKFMMPWTRLHGLKDYLDMPLLATEHEKTRVTFNLVPSLIDQLDLYCAGKTDRFQDLSRKPALSLSPEEKIEILGTFFTGNLQYLVEPYIRYRQLYRKKESCGADLALAADIFSSTEMRDLQVWSNLVWIDPMFRTETPVRRLFEKGKDFTEEDKNILLDYQISLLKRIIPTYQKLYNDGKIDITFTPYYHPILPLLVDTEAALEAVPDMILPEKRFMHPEDARWHIRESAKKFKELFGKPLEGMWPSEGSLSEEVLKIMQEEGIKWTASDQELLSNSAVKSGRNPHDFILHTMYNYAGAPKVGLFFRDKGLSDRIGFVYSNWDAQKAAQDFAENLRRIREILITRLDEVVVPVILDGENAWEYFPNDGIEFLRNLYQVLGEDPDIETVFFRDVAEKLTPKPIPRVMAGSWINHNFRIWIGHSEDNAAWNLLYTARQDLENYKKDNPNADPSKLDAAWRQIYFAQGSDWCWWYGDDHIGAYNAQFDELFRAHLEVMYNKLDITPPRELHRPIHRSGARTFMVMPESLVSPIIDGQVTHYYEWDGAGVYDCRREGQAMHRAERITDLICFAFDYDNIYIRLDFDKSFNFNDHKETRIALEFKGIVTFNVNIGDTPRSGSGEFEYVYNQVLEVKIRRVSLFKDGAGRAELYVKLYAGSNMLEKWPANDAIVIDIPEQEREIFWQV